MFRGLLLAGFIALAPSAAMAQSQACNTNDARHVVDELYRHMLERGADASSQAWVDQLSSGRSNVREVVRQIAQSPEHMQRFFKPSEGAGAYPNAIGDLYRHILGRQPDAAGTQAFVNMANQAGGLGPVVDQIINSAEYSQTYGDWGVPGSGGLVYCGNGSATNTTASAQSVGQPQMMWSAMDTNRDGIIQRNEWRGNARQFTMRDWNGDGVLSGDEVRAGAAAPANSAVYRDYTENAGNRFSYLDVNNNGYIEQNEWDGSLDAYYALDTNHDGRLARAEFNRNGAMNSFTAVDSNRDGRITLGEWRWSHASFDQMDSNRDGVITPQEYNSGAVPTTGR
jgi:Ca2+-binding EF-hand superfamily protein